MKEQNDKSNGYIPETNSQEFAINILISEFHDAVQSVAKQPEMHAEMLTKLRAYNPRFVPVETHTWSQKAHVLAQVVAGIYAPMLHGFATSVLKNVMQKKLSSTIIAPPRDAIPVALALQAHAQLQQHPIHILTPHVNRITAGIHNNQRTNSYKKSPLLELHLDQVVSNMNGTTSVVEVETGIYGTTSLVMAQALKSRNITYYSPIKFYGLGPNLSYIHAILSSGESWIAEDAQQQGLVDVNLVDQTMVILDTLEELGMQNMHQSVEELFVDEHGAVQPAVKPVTDEELEIAYITNGVVWNLAEQYQDISPPEIHQLLVKLPELISYSKDGFPFTLVEPIPPMDSKEEHFQTIRTSSLFHYPEGVEL